MEGILVDHLNKYSILQHLTTMSSDISELILAFRHEVFSSPAPPNTFFVVWLLGNSQGAF